MRSTSREDPHHTDEEDVSIRRGRVQQAARASERVDKGGRIVTIGDDEGADARSIQLELQQARAQLGQLMDQVQLIDTALSMATANGQKTHDNYENDDDAPFPEDGGNSKNDDVDDFESLPSSIKAVRQKKTKNRAPNKPQSAHQRNGDEAVERFLSRQQQPPRYVEECNNSNGGELPRSNGYGRKTVGITGNNDVCQMLVGKNAKERSGYFGVNDLTGRRSNIMPPHASEEEIEVEEVAPPAAAASTQVPRGRKRKLPVPVDNDSSFSTGGVMETSRYYLSMDGNNNAASGGGASCSGSAMDSAHQGSARRSNRYGGGIGTIGSPNRRNGNGFHSPVDPSQQYQILMEGGYGSSLSSANPYLSTLTGSAARVMNMERDDNDYRDDSSESISRKYIRPRPTSESYGEEKRTNFAHRAIEQHQHGYDYGGSGDDRYNMNSHKEGRGGDGGVGGSGSGYHSAGDTTVVNGLELQDDDEVVEELDERMLTMVASFLQTISSGPTTAEQALEAVTKDIKEWHETRAPLMGSKGAGGGWSHNQLEDLPVEMMVVLDVLQAAGLVRPDTAHLRLSGGAEKLHPLVLMENGSVTPARPCICSQVMGLAKEATGMAFAPYGVTAIRGEQERSKSMEDVEVEGAAVADMHSAASAQVCSADAASTIAGAHGGHGDPNYYYQAEQQHYHQESMRYSCSTCGSGSGSGREIMGSHGYNAEVMEHSTACTLQPISGHHVRAGGAVSSEQTFIASSSPSSPSPLSTHPSVVSSDSLPSYVTPMDTSVVGESTKVVSDGMSPSSSSNVITNSGTLAVGDCSVCSSATTTTSASSATLGTDSGVSMVRFDAITSPTIAVRSVPRPVRPLRPVSPTAVLAGGAAVSSTSVSANVGSGSAMTSCALALPLSSSPHQQGGVQMTSVMPAAAVTSVAGGLPASPVAASSTSAVPARVDLSPDSSGSDAFGGPMSSVLAKGVFLSWAERTQQSVEFVTFLRSSVGANAQMADLGRKAAQAEAAIDGNDGGPTSPMYEVMPREAQRMAEEGLFDEVQAIWGEQMIHLACAHVRSITQHTARNGGIAGVTFKREEHEEITAEEEEITRRYGRDVCDTLLGWMQRRSGDWHVWKRGPQNEVQPEDEASVVTDHTAAVAEDADAAATVAAAASSSTAGGTNAVHRSSSSGVSAAKQQKVVRYRLDPDQDACLADWKATVRRLDKMQIETARLALREETMLRELFKRCNVPLPPGYTRAACLKVLKLGHNQYCDSNVSASGAANRDKRGGGRESPTDMASVLVRKGSGSSAGKGSGAAVAKKSGKGAAAAAAAGGGGTGGDRADEEPCIYKEEGMAKGFSKNMTADALLRKALSEDLDGWLSTGDVMIMSSSSLSLSTDTTTALSCQDIIDDGVNEGAGTQAGVVAVYGGREAGEGDGTVVKLERERDSTLYRTATTTVTDQQVVAKHDVPPLQPDISYSSWSASSVSKPRKSSRSDSVSGWKDWASPTGSLGSRTPKGGAFAVGGGSFGVGAAVNNNVGNSFVGGGDVGNGASNGGSTVAANGGSFVNDGNGSSSAAGASSWSGGGGGGVGTPRNSFTPRSGSRDLSCAKDWSTSFPCPPEVADGDGRWGISGVADGRFLSKRIPWVDVIGHFRTISSTTNLNLNLSGMGGGGSHSNSYSQLSSLGGKPESGLGILLQAQRSSSSTSLSRTLSNVSNDIDMDFDDVSGLGGDDNDVGRRRRNSSVCSLPCGPNFPTGPLMSAAASLRDREIVAPSFRLIDDKRSSNSYSDESSGEEDISEETILRKHTTSLTHMKEKIEAFKAAKEARALASPRYCRKKAKTAGSGASGGAGRKGSKSSGSAGSASSAAGYARRGRPKARPATTRGLLAPPSPIVRSVSGGGGGGGMGKGEEKTSSFDGILSSFSALSPRPADSSPSDATAAAAALPPPLSHTSTGSPPSLTPPELASAAPPPAEESPSSLPPPPSSSID